MGERAQEYTIGEACKILNITQAGIRFYERKGIIESKRKETNGYRYYTFRDINTIMTIREYSNLGFSLEEARKLIYRDGINFLGDDIEEKINEVNEVIIRNIKILEKLKEKRDVIENIKSNLNKFTLKYKEPMYILRCQNDEKVILDKELQALIKQWSSKFPKVKYCSYLKKENIKPNCAIELCFSITEDEVDFKIENSKYVSYQNNQKCIYTIIEVDRRYNHKKGLYESIKPGLKFIEENKFELNGDLIGNKITTLFSEEQKDYYEVYYPIK